MAAIKACESGDTRRAEVSPPAVSVAVAAGATILSAGAEPTVHFQPGTEAGSSNKESSSEVSGALLSLAEGSKRRVRENPGMFRLVWEKLLVEYSRRKSADTP